MTDKPAVLVSQRSTLPTQQQPGPMQIDMRVAAELAKSDIVPRVYRNKPANILVAIGLGRSLGLEPASSLYGMHVIDGTPSPSAKLQAALVRRAGHRLRVLESDMQKAVVQIVRSDDPEFPFTVTYSVADAEAAGLLDKSVERWNNNKRESFNLGPDFPFPCTPDDLKKAGAPSWATPSMLKRRENWFSNRSEMLHHRAVTRCVGRACPEVVSGLDFDTPAHERDDAPAFDPVSVVSPTEQANAPVVAPEPEVTEPEPAAEPTPDIVDAEIVEPTETEPTPEPEQSMTAQTLKVRIQSQGISQADVIREAQKLASHAEVDAPATLAAICAEPNVLNAVVAWLDAERAKVEEPF